MTVTISYCFDRVSMVRKNIFQGQGILTSVREFYILNQKSGKNQCNLNRQVYEFQKMKIMAKAFSLLHTFAFYIIIIIF